MEGDRSCCNVLRSTRIRKQYNFIIFNIFDWKLEYMNLIYICFIIITLLPWTLRRVTSDNKICLHKSKEYILKLEMVSDFLSNNLTVT